MVDARTETTLCQDKVIFFSQTIDNWFQISHCIAIWESKIAVKIEEGCVIEFW